MTSESVRITLGRLLIRCGLFVAFGRRELYRQVILIPS
jgi:hypothetical protein